MLSLVGRILIQQLQAQSRLGVYAHELEQAQPIELDISVETNLIKQAAESERLEHTVDYDSLAKAALDVVTRRHFRWLKRLLRPLQTNSHALTEYSRQKSRFANLTACRTRDLPVS